MRILLTLLTLICASSTATAGKSIEVRAGNENLEFGFLYDDYYRVESRDARRHCDEFGESDFLVALHLGRASGMELRVLLDWRRGGMSWSDITHRCELDSRVYYVDLPEDSGPPYGRALGHWKNRSNERIELSDREIRALVELRAVSEYSGIAPREVLRQKKGGKSAASIAENGRGSADKGKGASKGKDKGKAEGGEKGKGKRD